jgi:hypothetical protein
VTAALGDELQQENERAHPLEGSVANGRALFHIAADHAASSLGGIGWCVVATTSLSIGARLTEVGVRLR